MNIKVSKEHMRENLKHLLLQINQKGLSFFPLTRINAVSIYTADFYENYDYDIVLPRQREKLVNILKQFDFKQVSGRVITNKDKSVTFEFAKPNFTLGDDPAEKTARLLQARTENQSNSLVVITPTQALLIYLKQFYDPVKLELETNAPTPFIDEMSALLYEQPANLDKVREWLGPSQKDDLFVMLKLKLRQAQRQGIEDRREFKFRSLISERIELLEN